MDIQSVLEQYIRKAVKQKYNVELEKIHLEHPENEKWGDYATNVAMELAKEVKQSPMEIAKNICYEIRGYELSITEIDKKYKIFDNVDFVQPGFINFKLSKEWLFNVLYLILADPEDYGSSELGNKKRIALEHSNVNPNKAAHIGHLRNACLGQFLERTYEFLGYHVEVQYYTNDLGVQVATSSMGMEKIQDVKPSGYKKYDHYAWDVYSKMESLINESDELKKERESIMQKLEDPTTAESIKQKELAQKILVEQLKTFQYLGVDYDVVVYESDIIALKMWEKAFEKLKQNENVYYAAEGKSSGCWLVKVSNSPGSKKDNQEIEIEEDKIIVRANGVPTYTGKDIAYHMWKFGLIGIDFGYKKADFGTQSKDLWLTTSKSDGQKNVSFSGVDRVLDVIGDEQTYAMEVVKKSLAYLGYKEESENMTHVNYGFVYLSPKTAQNLGIDTSDGKERYGMSGRKGWGIKIDDFIDLVDEKLMSDHGEFEALKDVRSGAIKFEMLKFNTFQDVVFDLDSALNVKGFSGPYIQYTYARTNSVLERTNWMFDKSLVGYHLDLLSNSNLNDKEISVLRYLYKFPEVVARSALEFAPNILCNYLYDLCQRFNTFYNELSILNAPDEFSKEFRLMLTSSINRVLSNGLFLLGITAPRKM
ncbi:arginine--tRNA ligase [candidate division WWE3 bacterium RIFCSPLOWO2_01_FULL_37_15]|uniref:Arginine--tRNA ligase n=1 Tax=candidate division WWE3 bacterium RIFCSPLOWO2_01_FULL_37_15 TaxID=1802622 RepID=A0A1F4UVQ1_UNCKA|nr:MAG: arginine--tRNA ligase [candidate division WWE3 bacterium RIFCSPLOWO2_01_FULL_37_15]